MGGVVGVGRGWWGRRKCSEYWIWRVRGGSWVLNRSKNLYYRSWERCWACIFVRLAPEVGRILVVSETFSQAMIQGGRNHERTWEVPRCLGLAGWHFDSFLLGQFPLVSTMLLNGKSDRPGSTGLLLGSTIMTPAAKGSSDWMIAVIMPGRGSTQTSILTTPDSQRPNISSLTRQHSYSSQQKFIAI